MEHLDVDHPWQCNLCPCNYKEKRRLNEHKKRKHMEFVPPPPRYKVQCPIDGCDHSVRTREDLADHCGEFHQSEEGEFAVETKVFPNEEEFMKWKGELEDATIALFTLESNQATRRYFWCTRGNRRREKKGHINKPSKRTQSHCPAFITAFSREGGRIEARFCADHAGHERHPTLLPLSQRHKDIIFQYVDQGLHFDALLKELRSLPPNSPLHWIDHIALMNHLRRRTCKLHDITDSTVQPNRDHHLKRELDQATKPDSTYDDIHLSPLKRGRGRPPIH